MGSRILKTKLFRLIIDNYFERLSAAYYPVDE
jgi:hypothetical protein